MSPLDYREEKRLAAIKAEIRPASNASEEDKAKIDATLVGGVEVVIEKSALFGGEK